MAHIKDERAERQEIIKQFIELATMNIADLPLAPRVDAYVTNNFLQGTLSRNLGYDDDGKKWHVLKVDSSGNLKTTASVANNIFVNVDGTATPVIGSKSGSIDVNPGGREVTYDPVFDSVSIPAGGEATHLYVDLQHAGKITLLAFATGTLTLRPQISDNGTDFYDYYDETDTLRTFTINNERKAIRLESACPFFRVVAENNGASEVQLSLTIVGQG